MDFLLGFQQPNSPLKAALFYLAHFVIMLVVAAALGAAFGGTFGGGMRIGQVFAIVYSTALCAFVIYQRKLDPKYYGTLAITLPASAILGGLGGLIVPAFLTTRGN